MLFLGLILSISCLYSTYVFSSESSLEADKELRAGVLFLGEGNYEEALGKFLKAQELDPLNANAHYYLGMVYSQTEEFWKAASSYRKALELNPELKEVHFELGMVYYQLKQYKDALVELEEAEKYAPEDAMVYYYQGLTYYELKKYYKSISPFKKVRELDPELSALSYFWEGMSLFQQGLYKKAEYSFREVKSISQDSQLEKSAEEFLQAIKEYTKEVGFNSSIGVEYDDNVTLQPIDENAADISGKEDWRTVVNAELARRIFSKWGEFGLSYSFYQSLQADLTDYNVQDHTASIYFSSDMRPFQPFIQYSYDYCLVDNEKYMEKHTLLRSMDITWLSSNVTQAYDQYEKTNYSDSPEDKDQNRTGYANTLGLNQYFYIMQDKGYIKVSAAYKDNRTEGSDWDYSSWKAALGLSVPLPLANTTLKVGSEYEDSNFFNEDSSFDEKRKDENFSNWLEVVYKINEEWNLSLSYKHINNDSNIDFYNYTKNITSLFVNYSF